MKRASVVYLTLIVGTLIGWSVGVSNATTEICFADNFNSADTNDVSAGIATPGRQSGSFATAGYGETGPADDQSIVSNQLADDAGAVGVLDTDVDFTSAFRFADGFEVAFDAALTSGTDWLSPWLSTHDELPAGDRGESRFGLLIWANGTVRAYKENAGAQGTETISSNDLATALGSWDIGAMNSYSLVATCTTTTNGSYDLSINGVEVLSDIPYTIGTGGFNGTVNWEEINLATSGVFDNLAISLTPVPPVPKGTLFIFR